MSFSRKHGLALSCGLLVLAGSAAARENSAAKSDPDAPRIILFPARGLDHGRGENVGESRLRAKTTVLTYHGGSTITSAKVVLIFWGPTFVNPASADYAYAQAIISDRNQFGTTPEYNVITQYSGIQLSNLGTGTADWFDPSSVPANVTDAIVQAEVNLYLASHPFDASTIYEVYLPSTSYSSDGTYTSCGGTNVGYCAYHSWIGSGASATKYSVHPYPSCSGCQYGNFTAVQNAETFFSHETREAVTDATGDAWYDSSGYEADDECAWSPPHFIDAGFAYQDEWSNAAGTCITETGAGAPPAAPTLTVFSNFCFGSNEADWTAPSGAANYELWGSASSSFTFPGLYYSGPRVSVTVNVSGTTYFEVRACNANGCSPFSNSGRATHSLGCK
jgi:hypothetical protein